MLKNSYQPLFAENLNIQSQQINIDKKTKITIFRDQVIAKDQNNNQLSTELAEYNKELKLLKSQETVDLYMVYKNCSILAEF